jgi:hypothetical protein
MEPKYKSKMRQKQRESAGANRADSKESNKLLQGGAARFSHLCAVTVVVSVECLDAVQLRRTALVR